jgi:dUTP pyrophosphatase
VGLVCDRSSLAKRGLKTAGGVIDAGYRGELGVLVWNLSRETQHVKKGERCAQLLVIPIVTPAPVESEDLGATARGAGGFGSTGR